MAECTPAVLTHEWVVICIVSSSFMLFRLSIDFIQTASKQSKKFYSESHHAATADTTDADAAAAKKKEEAATNGGTNGYGTNGYGSIANGGDSSNSASEKEGGNAAKTGEEIGLLSPMVQKFLDEDEKEQTAADKLVSFGSGTREAVWSLRFQILLLAFLLAVALLRGGGTSCVLPPGLVWTCIAVVLLGAVLTYRDIERERMGYFSRFLYLSTVLSLIIPMTVTYFKNRGITLSGDEVVVNAMGVYGMLVIGECFFVPSPGGDTNAKPTIGEDGSILKPKKKDTLSTAAVANLLKPYVWPDETTDSAFMNRVRSSLTWVCVILSKVCNLSGPLLLGKASTALAHEQYTLCVYLSAAYATVNFLGKFFKESQQLVYLRVAQAAYVHVSDITFVHLHRLSLDWHLRKKLGEVMRSMDRGIAACDTLMRYLFLWLVPAIVECIVVCVMFATYYNYAPLAIVVFYSVWIYIVWTIIVTLERKKYRKALVKSDNEWHDRITDSLINYETVKYFTGEEYERKRFVNSIQNFQQEKVVVQASMSFLNITQQLILQICLALSLGLATVGIKQRIDCCTDHGCGSGVSECCRAIDSATCPGMEVGDFVAVFTYTLQLFTPLNFLGSVYNAIVMAIVDLTNLSQLLAIKAEIEDAPDAMILPETNEEDEDETTAVEFDNVHFHYPTQPESKGLKGVSFKCKRGTTTAIVGPTGAGKTTISRLFLRFYDVLGGAVKVNGKDVRTVSQKSLREKIGVVPQAASMFNDTIRENMLYGYQDATQEQLDQAVKDAQLLTFIESMKEGWETVVGDRGLKLSGGEKQRAAIARCLLKDPPFILLDEATSALDSLTESSVQEALDRLGSQRTVLVIAHRLGTIRNADKIIVLKDGVVAEEGTHDELVAQDEIYANMWNKQLHSASNTGSRDSLVEESES